MLVKKLREVEKKINKNLMEAWRISEELSREIGTEVFIELERQNDYNVERKFVVKVPRPCGCCFVGIDGVLRIDTPSLKEIVLKLREIEKLAVEYDPDYADGFYGIYVAMGMKEFLEMPLEKIFGIWKAENDDMDDRIDWDVDE